MSTQHDSEGFMSTLLEGEGARRKDNYYQDSEENEVRFREADDEYINDSKKISLELLGIDARDITLGAIHPRALHHEEGSLRDVQRTCLSLK